MSRRTAAALLLTQGDGDGVEVFLCERSPELRFFGGYWALPGGTLGDEDKDAVDEGAALLACAHRELFEETGMLWRKAGERLDGAACRRLRELMLQRDRPGGDPLAGPDWPAFVQSRGSAPPLAELCRIETPPFAPVRYDTVFFHVPAASCVPATGGDGPEVWPGELVQGRWFRPRQALQRWRQGELLLVPPLVILLEHLAGAADLAAFARAIAATAQGYRDGRLHRVRFSPGIVLAPLRTPTLPPATTTNCYIVGHERLFVVDPGSPEPAEQQRLLDLLAELEAGGARTEGILVSHHHPDHIGGVAALSRARGLPVHGHALTLTRLPAAFARGRELGDGDRIDLGAAPDGSPSWHLRVLHTPGHDRGHLCFGESRYGTVLVGDMLSTVSTIIVDPPEGHLATYLQSLERLGELPIATLYPAHGPAMRDGQRLVRQYLRHRRQREASLVQALAQGGGTVDELLPKVYWDADPRLYRFAARSLQAGLEKLREEGRAGETGGRWGEKKVPGT